LDIASSRSFSKRPRAQTIGYVALRDLTALSQIHSPFHPAVILVGPFSQYFLGDVISSATSGVYFILKSLEIGPSFRSTVPRFPVEDPDYRIIARQRCRYTHFYYYILDEVLEPLSRWSRSACAWALSYLSRSPTTSTAIPTSNGTAPPPSAISSQTPGWRATQIHEAILSAFRLKAGKLHPHPAAL
jgi:hypothetical protein